MLEEKGYLARVRDPADRRVTKVQRTLKGKRSAKKASHPAQRKIRYGLKQFEKTRAESHSQFGPKNGWASWKPEMEKAFSFLRSDK